MSSQHLGFLLPARKDSAQLLLSLLKSGYTVCPLNCRLPDEQLGRQMQDMGCSAYFSDRALDVPIQRIKALDPTPVENCEVSLLLATSGSTARPKIAALSYENLTASAIGVVERLQLMPEDRWLATMPLWHVSGIGPLIRCDLAGADLVFPDSRWSIGENLVRNQITHVSLVPTQLGRLVDELPEAPRSLRAVLIGGAAAEPDLVHAAAEKGYPIYLSYGLTEMASTVTCAEAPFQPGDPINAGTLLRKRELRIDDLGEIWVGGDTLFKGYWEDGRLKPQRGEFGTGDLARWTHDGQLQLLGRKDRMFISGGENIQPEEVEEALCELPDVLEAIIVPVADREWGKCPAAFLRCEGELMTVEQCKQALSSRLPKYKHPIEVYSLPDLPSGQLKHKRSELEILANQKVALTRR